MTTDTVDPAARYVHSETGKPVTTLALHNTIPRVCADGVFYSVTEFLQTFRKAELPCAVPHAP